MSIKETRNQSTETRKKRGKLIIISAPSGSGKTTLCRKLIDDGALSLIHSVSVTTRPPRPAEKGGVDYRFVSRGLFERMIARGEFLEYEENFGNLYGTPREFIEKSLKEGRFVILSIDVKGAMKVRRCYPKDSVMIFILPPSLEALRKRLRSRMADATKAISDRLNLARKEISCKRRYDYRIVNDNLKGAYRKLKNIITSEMMHARDAD